MNRCLLTLLFSLIVLAANAQDAFWPAWQLQPGVTLDPNPGIVSMCMTGNNREPVVAYIKDGNVEVVKQNQTGWSILDQAINISAAKIKVIPGKENELYLAIEDVSSNINVLRFDGNLWSNHYNVSGIYSSGTVSFDMQYDKVNDLLYFMYQEASFPKNVIVNVIFDSSSSTILGGVAFSNGDNLSSFSLLNVDQNNLYFSCTDLLGEIFVIKYDGTNWSNISPAPIAQTASLSLKSITVRLGLTGL